MFKLNPATKTLTTLHSFNGTDGTIPVAGVVFDAAGALYGTTATGGAHGFGTVFKLDPVTNVLTVLHSFTGADGATPLAGLVFDAAGALYGTTANGGAHGVGTVFKLNPVTQSLTTLHVFTGGTEGANPAAGLVFDTNGALYGTTVLGGVGLCNCGTVFKLDPATKVLTTLVAFDNIPGGANPYAGLVFDTTGALYGTTSRGGGPNRLERTVNPFWFGTVFKLDFGVLTTLHTFVVPGAPGIAPHAGLVFDTTGALYGTTLTCNGFCLGTVFKLVP